MINDDVKPVVVLDVVKPIGGDEVVNLFVAHPSFKSLLVDIDVMFDGQEWVVGLLTKLKAYPGHRGLL